MTAVSQSDAQRRYGRVEQKQECKKGTTVESARLRAGNGLGRSSRLKCRDSRNGEESGERYPSIQWVKWYRVRERFSANRSAV